MVFRRTMFRKNHDMMQKTVHRVDAAAVLPILSSFSMIRVEGRAGKEEGHLLTEALSFGRQLRARNLLAGGQTSQRRRKTAGELVNCCVGCMVHACIRRGFRA